MLKQNVKPKVIRIEKNVIRRYFYFGFISAFILLTMLLSLTYTLSLKKEYLNKIEQLSASIITGKKQFLRNAVDRTIYFIEKERARVRQESSVKNLTEEQINTISIERISDHIRSLRLIDHGYIWINRIVDYSGGDNYAIREIHPNLPHTEGQWLSTNTTDIRGNQPYEVELNGINKDGELFFDYYFKEIDSEKISHKMSFAKLYKPYNWVVATGVYLDDVDQLIQNEIVKMEKTYSHQKFRSFLMAIIAILISIGIMVVFEKQIRSLIISYENEVEAYTKSLEVLSVTDMLTGLYNRLKLDEVFMYEIQQGQRYKNQFSIILFDLDKFKRINDTYGHQIGDQVLQETAKILSTNVRTTDTFGRWGGEEFLIICPETSLEGARLLAEKIRTAFETHDFVVIDRVTSSFGVSTFHDGDSKESMISRADKSLYHAKEDGRNRVGCENCIKK